jgi:L-threonylcarbamoyladenylate synthase
LKKTIKRPHIQKVDPLHPEKSILDEAAAIIRGGGVVVFPTRCLYGLATDAFNVRAVQRIFAIKQRSADKPILVLIHSKTQLNRLVGPIPPDATVLMDHFWQGNITFLLKSNPALPHGLTAGTGKIGVRMAGHPVAAALVQRLDNPITGTSANLSTAAGCRRIAQLPPEVAHAADLILDAGTLKGGTGSTILDVTVTPPRMMRSGGISEAQIKAALQDDQQGFQSYRCNKRKNKIRM